MKESRWEVRSRTRNSLRAARAFRLA